MISRWSIKVIETIQEILDAQHTFTDLEWDLSISPVSLDPNQAPIPMACLCFWVPNPILGQPDLPAMAMFPAGGKVNRDALESQVRQILESLAQRRSGLLTGSLQNGSTNNLQLGDLHLPS